jgi:hypothetical protein
LDTHGHESVDLTGDPLDQHIAHRDAKGRQHDVGDPDSVVSRRSGQELRCGDKDDADEAQRHAGLANQSQAFAQKGARENGSEQRLGVGDDRGDAWRHELGRVKHPKKPEGRCSEPNDS